MIPKFEDFVFFTVIFFKIIVEFIVNKSPPFLFEIELLISLFYQAKFELLM